MNNFVTIEIPYKSELASLILTYTASFNTTTNFKCNALRTLKDSSQLILEASYGKTEINFLDNKIIIDFQKKGSPVGLYFSADMYQVLKLSIEFVEKSEIESKKKILEKFFDEAVLYNNKKEQSEIICKILKNGHWRELSRLPKRPMSTIYLCKKNKDRIFNDLKKFFDLEKEYKKLGIPWKRNYLLEGPPGTGKSSLIFALASEFNMDIYIINLGPNVDDSVFMSAVSNLPSKTILLLEDIDALFVERKANDSNKSLVSFSGILNVLDGMARKSGLVTFMTTNFKENLDKALIRPSRIDFMMNFGKCGEDEIKYMFYNFFPDKKDLFNKFYKKISSINLRICILQQFFMECKFNDRDLFDIKRIREILSEMDNSVKSKNNLYV
jgi:SpoVK/Ycf46/Vps4 family AAA+-type ATPase